MTVKRLVMFAMVAAGLVLAVQKIGSQSDIASRERLTEMCHRVMAAMPESFPPKRMMADLATIKEQNARILEILEKGGERSEPNE